MDRRQYLGALGLIGSSAVSGCLGSEHEAINEFGYRTLERRGVEVPLAPVDDVIGWFDDDNILFVDTRTRRQYDYLRIEGAVYSPAADGLDENDPIDAVSTDTRIVTYCVCPHDLATSRGANAIRDGYTNLYALDEGLQRWVDQGHPIEGDGVESED